MNLFGTNGLDLFGLWDRPISSFCNQVNTAATSNITAIETFKIEKKNVSRSFLEGPNANKKFKVKENGTSVSRLYHLRLNIQSIRNFKS